MDASHDGAPVLAHVIPNEEAENLESQWKYVPQAIGWAKRRILRLRYTDAWDGASLHYSPEWCEEETTWIWWPSLLFPSWGMAARDKSQILLSSAVEEEQESERNEGDSRFCRCIRIAGCKKLVRVEDLAANRVPRRAVLGPRESSTGLPLYKIVAHYLGLNDHLANLSTSLIQEHASARQIDGLMVEEYKMSAPVAEWGVVKLKEVQKYDFSNALEVLRTQWNELNYFHRVDFMSAMEEALTFLSDESLKPTTLLRDAKIDFDPLARWTNEDENSDENASPGGTSAGRWDEAEPVS